MNKQSPLELSNDQLDAVVGGARGARNNDDYGYGGGYGDDDHRRRGHDRDHDRDGRGRDHDHDRGGYYY